MIGLAPRDEKWLAGKAYVGVWHGTAEDARKRQEALDVVPFGRYQAMAVSPLASGRLNPPDICLVYATPGQMIILINGLQYTGYKKFEWGVVGETACADSWGRALKTGEPSLSMPCFAERRYGGVPDEEMLMALRRHLAKAIAGMKRWPRTACAIRSRPMASRATCAPAWACPTPEITGIRTFLRSLSPGNENEIFVEIRHGRLWGHRIYRAACGRISGRALPRRRRSEMGDGRRSRTSSPRSAMRSARPRTPR